MEAKDNHEERGSKIASAHLHDVMYFLINKPKLRVKCMKTNKLFLLVAGVMASASAFAGDVDNNFNLAPEGAVMTSVDAVAADALPTYHWEKGKYAAWHNLWVSGPGYSGNVGAYAVGGTGCSALTTGAGTPGTVACEKKPAAPKLKDCGNYDVWVQGGNQNGSGPWSAPHNFTFKVSAVAATPVEITANPVGPGHAPSPIYNFTKVDNASYYQVWVGSQDSGLKVFDKWVDADGLMCAADEPNYCSVGFGATVPALTDGDYEWYVRPWNCTGSGPWTPVVNFRVGA